MRLNKSYCACIINLTNIILLICVPELTAIDSHSWAFPIFCQLLQQLMSSNKTQSLSNIIKVYSSWKATQPIDCCESNLIQQKLHPKFIKYRTPKETHIQYTEKREINLVELKSKELIPLNCEEDEETQPANDHERNNINFLKRKNTGVNTFTRYKSLESGSVKSTHQKKVTLTLPNKPDYRQKSFRIKADLCRARSPDRGPLPTLKGISLGEFCISDKRQYTIFLKKMVKSDLQMLQRPSDERNLDQYVFKIKKQELLRKARAINRWHNFNYNEIQE